VTATTAAARHRANIADLHDFMTKATEAHTNNDKATLEKLCGAPPYAPTPAQSAPQSLVASLLSTTTANAAAFT